MRSVPLYHKINVDELQRFLWERLPTWANNGNSVEEIWENFKNTVFEGIEAFVPYKLLKQDPDPEFYNREVKRLKRKVRVAYSKRKLGQQYRQEFVRLSQKLLSANRHAQEAYLRSALQNNRNSWAEFYRYVKRRKGNRVNIPMIRDSKGEPALIPLKWRIT